MNGLQDNIRASALPAKPHDPGQDRLRAECAGHPRQRTQVPLQSENWDGRSERWAGFMVAAQNGERQVYEKLLRELDVWLRRYYMRRLPGPAAEDARQDALLAIHANRHSYVPSGSFGAWVAAIARHKWIDRIREASRFTAATLHDDIPVEDHGRAAISAISVDRLLSHLKAAQADVIRLVKLQGLSIEDASGVTGQSAALVKINLHRGLKKLSALVSGDAIVSTTSVNSPTSRRHEPYRERIQMRSARCARGAVHRWVKLDCSSEQPEGDRCQQKMGHAVGV
jgi:RNA polymerase sigma factor (sigma-70 family)